MDYNLSSMAKWERRKACFLLECADDLDMDLDCCGELSVNPHSGYTYLWCENYDFSLCMPICCDLQKSDVSILWTNSYNGNEVFMPLSDFDCLDNIIDACKKLSEKADIEEAEEDS